MFARAIVWAAVLAVIVFPFTNRAKGLVFNQNMFTLEDNELINNEVVPYITKNFPNYRQYKIYYAHAYLSIALGIDPFDTAKHGALHALFTDKPAPNTLVIWDDWFARTEEGMSLEQLSANKNFALCTIVKEDINNRSIEFAVFSRKDSLVKKQQ